MKTISSRTLKRGTPEDALGPGEALLVKKSHGRLFEVRRVDAPKRSRLQGLKEVMREVPNRSTKKTDVVRWCQEDGL